MNNSELRKAVSSKDRLITKLQKDLAKMQRERDAVFLALAMQPHTAKLSESLAVVMRDLDTGRLSVPPADIQDVLDTASGISKLPF